MSRTTKLPWPWRWRVFNQGTTYDVGSYMEFRPVRNSVAVFRTFPIVASSFQEAKHEILSIVKNEHKYEEEASIWVQPGQVVWLT